MSNLDIEFADFLKNIPLLNKKLSTITENLLLKYISDPNQETFDNFFMSLTSNVDFKSITPFKLISNMMNFLQNPKKDYFLKFGEESIKYLAILIQIPNFISPNYEYTSIIEEFISFLFANYNQNDFIQKIITNLVNECEETINFLLYVLNQFFYSFSTEFFNGRKLPIMNLDRLEIINIFFSNRTLTESFCEQPFFFEEMNSLFTQSFLMKRTENRNHRICHHDLGKKLLVNELSIEYKKYYQTLAEIVCSFYNFGGICRGKLFEFISGFIRTYKNSIDEDEFHENTMTLLNFQSVMIDVALKFKDEIKTYSPFAPHMRSFFLFNEDDFPLAVSGNYSWQTSGNKEFFKNFYGDNESDVSSDNEEWKKKYSEVMKEEVEPKSCIFFFAALKCLSVFSANLFEKFLLVDIDSPDMVLIKRQKKWLKYFFRFKYVVYQTVDFIKCASSFLVKTAGNGERPTVAYQHLPEYVLTGIVEWTYFWSQTKSILYKHENEKPHFSVIEASIKDFAWLVKKKKFVRNPLILLRFFDFLFCEERLKEKNWYLRYQRSHCRSPRCHYRFLPQSRKKSRSVS